MADVTGTTKLALSWLALAWERAWSAFWPGISAVAAVLGLALLGAFAWLGPAVHAALLALALLVAAWSLGRPFRLPGRGETERRMEEAGGLLHRPLAALRDSPAGAADENTKTLWHAHLARMRLLKPAARLARFLPDTARQDRYALRFAALLLLALGLVRAGGAAPEQIRAAFAPLRLPALAARAPAVDAWITPPAYTGKPSVFLAAARAGAAVTEGPVAVPAGSVLKVRVAGGRGTPRLRLAGRGLPPASGSADGWLAEAVLDESGRLKLRQGVRDLGMWQVGVLPDLPPSVTVEKAVRAMHGTLSITYRAADDYGVTALKGRVTPPPGEKGAAAEFEMTPPGAEGSGVFVADLAAHPRAGLPAVLVLTATDGAGHSAESAPLDITLPERIFTNPLAAELARIRKSLFIDETPENRQAAANALAGAGQDISVYRHDIVVFMSLGSAVRRLVYDETPAGAASVRDLLWDVALKLEDGGLSVAARDLAEQLDALSKALADKSTPPAEVRRLMDEAQQRMREYLQSLVGELARRSRENGGEQMKIPPEVVRQMMNSADIGDMMRRMRELGESGARGDMQRMADALRNAVRNMSMGQGGADEKQTRAMQAIEELRGIVQDQQALLEKTSRAREGEEAKKLAETQDALRRRLGEAARKIGENLKDVPPALAAAGSEMKESSGALSRGKPGESAPRQKAALDEMQKGMDGAAGEIARGMQQMILSLGLSPGGEGGMKEGDDPLGRSTKDGRGEGGNLDLPAAAERRRVQQILDELRRRSNDYQRPKPERDYLDRLLDPAE